MISTQVPRSRSVSRSIPANSNPSSSQKSDSTSRAGPRTSSLVGRMLFRLAKAAKSDRHDKGSMFFRILFLHFQQFNRKRLLLSQRGVSSLSSFEANIGIRIHP